MLILNQIEKWQLLSKRASLRLSLKSSSSESTKNLKIFLGVLYGLDAL